VSNNNNNAIIISEWRGRTAYLFTVLPNRKKALLMSGQVPKETWHNHKLETTSCNVTSRREFNSPVLQQQQHNNQHGYPILIAWFYELQSPSSSSVNIADEMRTEWTGLIPGRIVTPLTSLPSKLWAQPITSFRW
jgi:hypothetical protein